MESRIQNTEFRIQNSEYRSSGVQEQGEPRRAPVPWRRHYNPIELCQTGSLNWILDSGLFSDSNDGCKGLQPSKSGNEPVRSKKPWP
jgi:hypothetical protein